MPTHSNTQEKLQTAEQHSSSENSKARIVERLKAEAHPTILEPSFTGAHIEKIHKRKLSGGEKKAWSKQRQAHFRVIAEERKLQAATQRARNIENSRPKKMPSDEERFIGHTNQELFEMICYLNVAHLEPDLRGKAQTNQLISRLSILSKEDLERMLAQINTFSKEMKEIAAKPISVLNSTLAAKQSKDRDRVGILDWSEIDWEREITSSFNAQSNKNFPLLPYKLFSYRLKKLQTVENIEVVYQMVSNLEVSTQLSEKMILSVEYMLEIELQRRALLPQESDTEESYFLRISEIENYILSLVQNTDISPTTLLHFFKEIKATKIDEIFFTQEVKQELLDLFPKDL